MSLFCVSSYLPILGVAALFAQYGNFGNGKLANQPESRNLLERTHCNVADSGYLAGGSDAEYNEHAGRKGAPRGIFCQGTCTGQNRATRSFSTDGRAVADAVPLKKSRSRFGRTSRDATRPIFFFFSPSVETLDC